METEVLEKTNITKEIDQSEKTEKKSLWDYAVELAKNRFVLLTKRIGNLFTALICGQD